MSVSFKKYHGTINPAIICRNLQNRGFLRSEFRSNGPVEVPESDLSSFQNFCTNYSVNFDTMFDAWICERHTDGFRRLCLRNLLRQIDTYSTEISGVIVFFPTGNLFSQFFYVGRENGELSHAFYHTLFNRPKLLDEFIEEFLYNCSNSFYCDPSCEKPIADLIEFLLTLPVSNGVGSQLWPHYPYSRVKFLKPADWIERYLNLITHPDLSEKFSKKLNRIITTAINSEIQKLRDHYHHSKHTSNLDLSFYNERTPVITYLADWISFCNATSSKAELSVATSLIEQLEHKFSTVNANITYLNLADTITLAQCLDLPIALQLIRRHVSIFYDTHGYRTEIDEVSLINLEWLRGFCAQYLASDDHIQEATTEFILHYHNPRQS